MYFWGHARLQPFVRFQKFDADVAGADLKQTDVGLNCVIGGANTRTVADHRKVKPPTGASIGAFILGLQLQHGVASRGTPAATGCRQRMAYTGAPFAQSAPCVFACSAAV